MADDRADGGPDLRLLRQAFGPLDPALDPSRVPSESHRRAHTEHLLAEYRSLVARRSRRRRSSRRGILAMTGAVATAAAGGVVAVVALDQPRPAPVFAATPRPLPVTGTPEPGAARLLRLAEVAARRPRPPRGDTVEHVVTDRWDLSTTVGGAVVSTAVIASRRELWRAARGAAVAVDEQLPPDFPADSDRAAWQRQGSPGLGGGAPARTAWAPGRFPTVHPDRPPTETAALESWLRNGVSGTAAVVLAAADLLRERVPTAPEQAALLRVLAAQPGIEHEGRTTDRAGRSGEAFRLVESVAGREVIDRLVLDPATAAILAHERVLTVGAVALPVRRPAVIGYTVFHTAGYVAALPG